MEKSTKSVLFLPFLQIPSGHHQVANTLIEGLKQIQPQIKCEKIDILAFSYGKIEKFVSKFYLIWIKLFPGIYNFIYRNSVYTEVPKEKDYRMYKMLFLYFVKKLLADKQPDIIVCSHSLPAHLLNHLKKTKHINTTVVNVYTDFFVHQLWGINFIDLHLVPTLQIKSSLIERGVSENCIFVTGIPVHPSIKRLDEPVLHQEKNSFNVLISGGNMGVGAIHDLIDEFKEGNYEKLKLIVLCGKNERLYKKLSALNLDNIKSYPYIASMDEMNLLYEGVDAIVTKPGGVTISECLVKRKPIFIYHVLPGQEKINLDELTKNNLVFPLQKGKTFAQIQEVLNGQNKLQIYQQYVENYHAHICSKKPEKMIAELL